ncbi:MAG TPA: aromatic amino acid lyase [Labilithrix sp.]|nr:aromatic amino acid lyase [Labilithrix sp.]
MNDVLLTGFDLSLGDVIRVARDRARVVLDRGAIGRMRAARKVVERALRQGDAVYGMNTGVAAKKRNKVARREIASFNRLLLENHCVGQGEAFSQEVVRAALLRIANGFARGTTTASPALAERIVTALNTDAKPTVRTLGSIGVGDLAPNAELAWGILGDYELGAGEGLALVAHAGFSTGLAALAVSDTARLLGAMEVAGALELEAFTANLSILDPAVAEARPHVGLRGASRRLRKLLADSGLWKPGAARNLQDPLTFRGMPHVFGAARDALAYTTGQLSIELNAASDNPLVIPRERRIISVWNGEIASLVAALDLLRIALAPVLSSACERLIKLLQAPLSGLPGGLAARPGLAEDALAELGVAAQALTAEARLLAQPVSFEIVSTSQAEGIEDRTTMAPLAARRLSEMVMLGERLCAIELLVAAQAVDLRRKAKLGQGTARAHARVRALVPFTRQGQAIPTDLEPLRQMVRSGRLSPPVL